MLDTAIIRSRWERAQAAMARAGIDALVATDKFNYWYLTGHLSREFDKKMRPMVFILTQDGKAGLLVYRQQVKKAQKTCPATHVFSYEDVPCPDQLFVEAFREMGLAQARVGMEFGMYERLGISYGQLQAITEALPAMKPVDGGGILQRLRVLKGPDEIQTIKDACAMSLDAWKRAVRRFQEGMSAPDVAAVVAAELIQAGSDFNVAGHVTVEISDGGVLREGDTVWCDFGGTLNGYQADVARRAVLGQPTSEQLRWHEQAFELLEVEINTIKAGVLARDVARTVADGLERLGYPTLGPRKRVGHGLGLSAAEVPSLSLADETVLEPGMVLTPEPRFNLPAGRVHLEEVVAVTETGCERLTKGADELMIAGGGV